MDIPDDREEHDAAQPTLRHREDWSNPANFWRNDNAIFRLEQYLWSDPEQDQRRRQLPVKPTAVDSMPDQHQEQWLEATPHRHHHDEWN